MVAQFETTDLLVSSLHIEDVAPYKDVAHLVIPQVLAGQTCLVYAESHGDPRQTQGQKECAWVSGVYVDGVGDVCRRRGKDLYLAQKHDDARYGSWVVSADRSDVDVFYVMRALNKVEGGSFNISWVKLGVIIL